MTAPKVHALMRELLPVCLAVGSVAWWVVSTNSAQDIRISGLESAVKSIATSLDGIEKRNAESRSELLGGIRRMDDKLSALLIQGYAPKSPRN